MLKFQGDQMIWAGSVQSFTGKIWQKTAKSRVGPYFGNAQYAKEQVNMRQLLFFC